MSFFDQFETNNKEAWFAKIKAELKGISIDSLDYKIGESIQISPYQHQEDIQVIRQALASNEKNNSWNIGCSLIFSENYTSNDLLLKILNLGVNAPEIIFMEPVSSDLLENLFTDIDHELIQTHFTLKGKADTKESIQQILHYKVQHSSKSSEFYLDTSVDSFLLSHQQSDQKTRLFCFCPKAVGLNSNDHFINEITDLFLQLKNHIDLSLSKGLDSSKFLSSCYFKVGLSTNLLAEISKIRAIKVLWANILAAYEITPQEIIIKTHSAESANLEDPNTQLLASTVVVIASIFGGVNMINISKPGKTAEDIDTLNIKLQHIMQMESKLDQVIDPVAGSYFIENLTDQIVEQVWNRMKKGG